MLADLIVHERLTLCVSGLIAQVIEEEFGADYPWLPFESLPE